MPLINSSRYPEIRALIDSTLTENQIPDSMISMSVFQGAAERLVIQVYPTAATETNAAAQERIQRATIYMTASLLVPSIPVMTGEHYGNYQYRRVAIDSVALAQGLRAMAQEELDWLSGDVADGNIFPTFFTVAPGLRPS